MSCCQRGSLSFPPAPLWGKSLVASHCWKRLSQHQGKTVVGTGSRERHLQVPVVKKCSSPLPAAKDLLPRLTTHSGVDIACFSLQHIATHTLHPATSIDKAFRHTVTRYKVQYRNWIQKNIILFKFVPKKYYWLLPYFQSTNITKNLIMCYSSVYITPLCSRRCNIS